jgi:hypothetical protein
MTDSHQENLMVGYDGVEPTSLGREVSSPTATASDPQAGRGTDSNLTGPIGPPVRPLVGTPLAGPDHPSTVMPDTIMGALGTTSGLGAAVSGSTQSSVHGSPPSQTAISGD